MQKNNERKVKGAEVLKERERSERRKLWLESQMRNELSTAMGVRPLHRDLPGLHSQGLPLMRM
jgi:hypothetical protein